MSDTVTISLKGHEELQRTLSKLPSAISYQIQMKAFRKAAKPLVNDAKNRVPVSGKKTTIHALNDFSKGAFSTKLIKKKKGELRRSIGVKPGGRKNKNGAVLYVGPRFGKGKVNSGWYAHFVEFGTVKQKAQPFMRPAWDRNRDRCMDSVYFYVKGELRKFVVKHAKKTA